MWTGVEMFGRGRFTFLRHTVNRNAWRLPQIKNARRLGKGNKFCAEILHFGLVGDAIWMLLPYYEGGTLTEVLENNITVTEDIWMRWAHQLLKTVQGLHEANVRFHISYPSAPSLFELCMCRTDHPPRPQAG